MNTFSTSIEIVLPVVAMLVIGRVYARMREFGPELTRGIGSLVFWVCLPALTFKEIVRADLRSVAEPRLCLTLFAILVFSALVGYRYARWRGLRDDQVGVVAQGAYRSNMLYIGLPILVYFARSRAEAGPPELAHAAVERVVQITAFATAFSIPILNALSIVVFELPARKTAVRTVSVGGILVRVLANPLVIAVALAVLAAGVFGIGDWFDSKRVPGKIVDLAAASALPMVLFSIGANLDIKRACMGWRETLPVAAYKLAVMPALGLGLMRLLGLRAEVLVVGVILLACPDAATGHAMAAEYKADEELAGELVAATTLLCPFTLVVWLAVLSTLA
jgi:predicted permease